MQERNCNRCKRPLLPRQKKYCSHACANRDTMKRKSEQAAQKPWRTCSIEGCVKPSRSRIADKCPMHYHREYRYGTIERTTDLIRQGLLPRKGADLTGTRHGTLTARRYTEGQWECQCDCGATRRASVGELNRTGEANTCGIKANHLSDDVDYAAAHDRVHRARGKAIAYRCIDCGRQAQHWSYDHADPDERTSTTERTFGIAYSLDASHYEPRCVSCHKTFDMARINSTNRIDFCALD